MITPRDFDRLSAYLDNQLSPTEKAALETRLEREPELKAALDNLRATVRALRSLPTLKPPRNFTLSPAQARAIVPSRRVFPALRLATAFAALAFVIVVVGDVATNLASPRPAAVALVPMTAVVAEKGVAATEAPAPTTFVAQGVVEPTEASRESAGVTTSAADATTEAAAALAVSIPTGTAVSGTSGEDEARPDEYATSGPGETETAQEHSAAGTAVPEPTLTAPRLESASPTPTLVLREAQFAETETAGLPPLRYVEAGLALLTLLLAVAAWFLRGR